jgi:hypothetical protein
MRVRRLRLWTASTLAACAAALPAQAPPRATATVAAPDASAVETGEFVLSIPGVADDFVVFADGQWSRDQNGQARLGVFAQRRGALDRDLYVELQFDGEVLPGQPAHPPAGSPITTLQASAYAPAGPVDPSTFVYYTSVTGTITGLRAFAGLRCDLQATSNAQFGAGANNKNVGEGLAVDLQVTITQPSISEPFAPTGPAELRADFVPQADRCASHTDPDPAHVANGSRRTLAIGGLADDYLLMPDVRFVEDDQGQAQLTGTVRSQTDRADAWTLDVTFSNRVDPGDAGHPPVAVPIQDLLATSYAANGGPVDPDGWRYYTSVAGALHGVEDNDGGELSVQQSIAAHVGVGAGQNNTFFGLSVDLTVAVTTQPNGATLAPTGTGSLRANLATECILPSPDVTSGNLQSIDTVTGDTLVFTGNDLGFVEQAALGPFVLGADQRLWFDGFVRVIDHQTVEVSIPQGLAPGTYPQTLLTPTRLRNPLSVDLVEPLTPTLRTENDRLTGEPQHWVSHQGNVQGFAFCFVILSFSNQPSFAPGLVSLGIGAQFSDYAILDVAVQDPITRASVVTLPAIPAALLGAQLFSQSALMDSTFFPLIPTDVAATDY